MSTAATRRKSHRTKRIRYAEDSDEDVELSTPPRSQPPRQSRTAKPVQSYREDSDDSHSDDSDFDNDDDDRNTDDGAPVSLSSLPTQRRQQRFKSTQGHPRKRKRPATRSTKPKHAFELFKRRKPNTTATTQHKPHFTVLTPQGFIPAWQTLPYQVLLNIMKFAAYPLYGKASRANSSINWLLGTGLLCKAFHEACSATLLFSPPLYPSHHAHGLIRLLEKDPNTTFTNYRSLIKSLDIEVKNLLLRKSGIRLEDLITNTPLLQRLRLYHNHDDLNTLVWAQPIAMKGRKWSYPEDLAATLNACNIKLTAFEWNGRFASPLEALNNMTVAHSQSSFRDLQNLVFLNLTYPEKHTDVEIERFSSLLLAGLAPLSSLRSIALRNCDILTDRIMSQLAPDLTYLEVANCSTFTSDNLSAYLAIKGSTLTTLRLVGNQTMSLGFIPHLKDFCPRLQNIHIDLTYVDPTSYRDREPLYDDLLPNGQPTWPTTLINIDLEYLRQFSAKEAEGFLTSLVDAAPELQRLRRLSVKAIINAGWRDRAQMRQKWMPKLTDVFLCTDEPQRLYLPVRSKKSDEKKSDEMVPRSVGEKIGRRSGRIQEIQTKREEETEESDAYSPDSGSSAHGVGEKRSGTCSVVELTLSDQRPAQDQYNENDFLDDEMSGDDDFRA